MTYLGVVEVGFGTWLMADSVVVVVAVVACSMAGLDSLKWTYRPVRCVKFRGQMSVPAERGLEVMKLQHLHRRFQDFAMR